MSAEGNQRDGRLIATERIWKYGVAMLAVSLAIVLLTRLYHLPIYVVLMTGLASAAVWMFGGDKHDSVKSSEKEKALEDRLSELEKRLQNVETISRVELQLGKSRFESSAKTETEG